MKNTNRKITKAAAVFLAAGTILSMASFGASAQDWRPAGNTDTSVGAVLDCNGTTAEYRNSMEKLQRMRSGEVKVNLRQKE